MYDMIFPVTDIASPDIDIMKNTIGSADTRLKAQLDLIYEVSEDRDGRLFSGLHLTLLPLFSTSSLVFSAAAWITH